MKNLKKLVSITAVIAGMAAYIPAYADDLSEDFSYGYINNTSGTFAIANSDDISDIKVDSNDFGGV